jgi:outer membrane biosynthesis protein TonB
VATAGTVAGDPYATTNATRTAGAFVASAGLHALILAALGGIVLAHGASPSPPTPPIVVQLVTPAASPPPRPAPLPVASPVPASPPVRAPVPDVSAPPKPSRYVVPWAGTPARPDPPSWMFDRPMVVDGVAMLETRNVVMLGEAIERKIVADFAETPAQPVLLRSPDQLGYPIEAIEAGVEGRVVVWMGVDEDGKVVDSAILDGPPVLAEWVAARVNRLIEKPARNAKGDGMRGWVAVEIDFTREAAAQAAIARELASPSIP